MARKSSLLCFIVTTALGFPAVARGVLQQDSRGGNLPIVDLGYERHQAASYNQTGQFYNFSNIRYAAAPNPSWISISNQFVQAYLRGQKIFNESSFNLTSVMEVQPLDPRTTEDCLFMDIVVPQSIFDTAGSGAGAPVLVWIYGGGYTAGSKSDTGNPAGLIKRSQSDDSKGIIYVSFNYRLGALGWLSGPTLQKDGTANAGLHDQRFALEWIQQHIHLFGGDPERVTVFGESAGGGSAMHQITAYGAQNGPVPFAQALLQSPGWYPIVSNQQQEEIFNNFLDYANVSSLEEARELSTEQVSQANAQQVKAAAYGQFVYGPTVDGDFVPTLPGLAMLQGRYPKDLKVMVGHNAQEGLIFAPPSVQNNSYFNQYIVNIFPTLRAWPDVLHYISNELYPPIFDGSQAGGYTDQITRAAALTSELLFTCNTFLMNKAYHNDTYAYYFTVPPALHAEDVAYTYFNGPSEEVRSDAVAIAMQEYFTYWARTGTPNRPGLPFFPTYGANATVQNLNITGINQVMDPSANDRCNWWQRALYA